jgi:signal transduction histidine kinase
MDLTPAIQEILGELGQIMQADRIIFLQLPVNSFEQTGEVIEWRAADKPSISIDPERILNSTYSWFHNRLAGHKSVYLADLSTLPPEVLPERAFFVGEEVDSLLLVPLVMENDLAGVIAIFNPNHQKARTPENAQALEVVASMLSSLLSREQLLNTLEEKVAERTRELFTFFDLAMLAGETQEIADILQSALVKIMEISASEAAVIHLVDGDRHVLDLVAQQGFLKGNLLHLQKIQLNDAMITWLEGTGDEIRSSGSIGIPAEFVIPGFISAYHIALRARGKLQGLLSCYRLVESPYDPYQSSFLTAIGEQLGMAVENYRLRQKAEEIATIQERQRLARELHDAVSQSLYSLTLFARSGRDALEVGDQAKLSDSLEQLELNSLAALKEMRLLLYQLRSLALEEGGLLAAIETRFNLVEHRLGIQAVVQMDENLQLTDQVELELFRLITEALNNALKHAGANQVSVTLQSENGQVALAVKDNGRGFDLAQASAGMGLQNLRERVSALGGQIEISSQPGSGTRIRVEIPQLNDPAGEA